MTQSRKRRITLTIAGSDPAGGAGVQADLKTFAALGVYGYSAITQIIAQNSSAVGEISAVAPAMIASQIESVVAERRPDAVKTGALGGAAAVRAIARAIEEFRLPAPVVDPVIMSSSGTRLLERAGERALIRFLIPLARVITPNLPEVEALTGIRINGNASLRSAAQELIAMGARAALIKGGHRTGSRESVDVLFDGHKYVEFRARRVGQGAHGTGCALSAAIAAYLAHGMELEEAVRAAKTYVTTAIERSFKLGGGRPILEHFAPRGVKG
ncbi:MAG: bifunctional hydroxymethylpyrimidine kinase/phosphomethylpyrimidine kinase [Candidatus Binataceae bacterium]